MRVSEIRQDQILNCIFGDVKGNWLPYNMVINNISNWEIYSADCCGSNCHSVKIVAPVEASKEIMRDICGMQKANGYTYLMTTEEIASVLRIDKRLSKAWMWSCAMHGLTERKIIDGKVYWVIE